MVYKVWSSLLVGFVGGMLIFLVWPQSGEDAICVFRFGRVAMRYVFRGECVCVSDFVFGVCVGV